MRRWTLTLNKKLSVNLRWAFEVLKLPKLNVVFFIGRQLFHTIASGIPCFPLVECVALSVFARLVLHFPLSKDDRRNSPTLYAEIAALPTLLLHLEQLSLPMESDKWTLEDR
jgi:hypothetical protein